MQRILTLKVSMRISRLVLAATLGMMSITGLGAYQYIVSIDPELAENPSESAYAEAITVNVKASGAAADSAALETRVCTASVRDFGAGEFVRANPGAFLIIR